MVNRYTSDRRVRSDDAYTPGGTGGKRPDRCVIVYSQRLREAYKSVPIVIGGIEASLRRIAHFDYWSEQVRRSVLMDAKADLLVYGNAERQIGAIAQRLDGGEAISSITDLRGTAYLRRADPGRLGRDRLERPRYPGAAGTAAGSLRERGAARAAHADRRRRCGARGFASGREVLPPRAECTARTQRHPPALLRAGESATRCCTRTPRASCTSSPIPVTRGRSCSATATPRCGSTRRRFRLTTAEMDAIYELPYARRPASRSMAMREFPAYHMIRFSVAIQRGCFGGCTFCSITEHEGRIIQSRSEDSVMREIETIRDTVPGFTGVISDLGGPTANMYRLHCKSAAIESACRRPSCVYPGVCPNLNTDHAPLINLYRRARSAQGHQESADRLRRALRPRASSRPSTSRSWRPTTPAGI